MLCICNETVHRDPNSVYQINSEKHKWLQASQLDAFEQQVMKRNAAVLTFDDEAMNIQERTQRQAVMNFETQMPTVVSVTNEPTNTARQLAAGTVFAAAPPPTPRQQGRGGNGSSSAQPPFRGPSASVTASGRGQPPKSSGNRRGAGRSRR